MVSTSGFSGIERFVIDLSGSLLSTQYRPVIGIIKNMHNPNDELEGVSAINKIEYQVFASRGRFDPSLLRRFRQWVKENRIDLIHSNQYKANVLAAFATNGLRIPIVTTCHSSDHNSNNLKLRLYYRIDKFILHRFDFIATTADDVKAEVLKHYRDKSRVVVINNGIDISRFQHTNQKDKDKLKGSLGIDPAFNVVGMVGRLSKSKNHALLLESATEILGTFPNTFFLIVGDGPLRAQLEIQANKLSIVKNILFTGPRNDIPDLLSMIDVFVLPSSYEGLPLAMLEAMAAKVPVVVTPVGSIARVVRHNYSGLIIRNDSRSLGDAIKSLLENPRKRAALAENGYNVVKQHFTNEQMAKAYVDVYDKVLSQKA